MAKAKRARPARHRDLEARWWRGPHQVLSAPTGPWEVKWHALPRQQVGPGEPALPPPWVLEREEFRQGRPAPYGRVPWRDLPGRPSGDRIRIYRIGWPPGGVIVPAADGPREPYDPIAVAGEIFLDVQRAAPEEGRSLLRFVTRWGLLGVGIPGASDFGADAIAVVGTWLSQLKEWIETVHRLRRGTEKGRTWDDFAATLNPHLQRIHPALGAGANGLERRFRADRLLDVLCFALWDQVTDGAHLRRCPECRALFIPSRANQEYCGHLCANRPTVRRWKKKQKKKRLAEREKED
jgi:uncharacterized C2H2 Zn-finger protein